MILTIVILLSIIPLFSSYNNINNRVSINTRLYADNGGILSKLKTVFNKRNIKTTTTTTATSTTITTPSVRHVPPAIDNIDIWPDTKVAIIGAGISGLACAKTLSNSNYNDYIIIEKDDSPGGRVRTDEYQGYLLDRGFQVFLDAYPESNRFFDYEKLQLKKFLPGALVYYDSKFNRVADPFRRPMDILSSVFTPIGSLIDKIRVGLFSIVITDISIDTINRKEEMPTDKYLISKLELY
jgi:hypothetical protein